MIPFNKPYLTGKETHYIEDAVKRGKISGNGHYTKKCHEFFETTYGFNKVLLTTSCTDALEMCAILLDIQPGDEVILPSYTFVSTANAFMLRGAKLVFADSRNDHPGIDEEALAKLVTPKTKAIVVVHYAGVACDMGKIMDLANKNDLFVVEDAAQGIDATYKGKPLGGIGHLGCFSFHETKNIQCGEGGLLIINDNRFVERAEIIWEKGTNRAAFFRGEIDKYGWVDVGSSFLPSELNAAFLYAQLENIRDIQDRRIHIWSLYKEQLNQLESAQHATLPHMLEHASNNAHMFYLLCSSLEERSALIDHLKSKKILSVFHYLSLHKSPYFADRYQGNELPNSDRYTDTLLRLPMYYELTDDQVHEIASHIRSFYQNQ